MKNRPLLLGVCFTLLTQWILAQCPPPGFPQPGNTCPTAPILCENLDGYCATINNNNQTQPFPGCSGQWVLNNDEWFAFYAGSTTITIQVTPSNCSSNGNNVGLQGGIYNGCGGPVMDVQCQCTDDPFILTANNYVIGQIYWFVLDGCGGDVCDYSIDVLVGSTVGQPPANPGAMTGPATVCAGTSGAYSIPPPTGATIYNWTVTPAGIGTVSGSGSNVNINWANGQGGTAQVCVTTANACYSNPTPSCMTVEVVPKPTATISGSGILCQGSNTPVNLTITFTGTGPWTFRPTLNGVPQAPITTSQNPYTLSVTQAGTWGIVNLSTPPGNCTGTTSGTAVVTQVTLNPTATVTNTNCGLSTGSVNLTPAGGNAPYSFAWNNGITTEDLSNVPGGTYIVTVTDNNGCTKTLSATVADNPITFTVTNTITPNTTCMPTGNGSITLSVSPANNTYTYNWDNGNTTNSITNALNGTYVVTVSAGGNCTQTLSLTIPNQPNEPNATATVVGTTCDLSNGSINASVTGGVSPFTYAWSNGATTLNQTGVLAGGYTLTVTGANGCTDELNVNVPNNNPPFTITPTIVANTNCNGIGNGSITLAVAPANSYTFNWSTGGTTNSQTGLLPGTYQVTVSAGGSCTNTADITVPDQPNNPNINFTTVPSTCELSNGSINVSVTGGTTPYTYSWSTGATTASLTGLLAGPYSLTVTGANGCTDEQNIDLTNNNPPFNVNANILPATNCNGVGNGSISLSVTPANAYTFTWFNGSTANSLTGLLPGSYQVTVSAGGACTSEQEFTVPDVPNEPNPNGNIVQSTCDLANGSINASVTGGVSPYTYAWSTGATTLSLTNLVSDTYTLTVTGANGCTGTIEFFVGNNNPPFTVTPTVFPNTSCNANGTGSITLSVSPPGGNITYQWSNGNTTAGQVGLQSGNYSITVSKGGSCTEVLSIDVPDNPNEPQLSSTEISAKCGLNNGSINLNVGASIPPYTYAWSSGQSTQDLNNIPGGLYVVTVTGGNGCTNELSVFLDDEPIYISLLGEFFNNTKCGVTGNGSIVLDLTPSNVSVSWSNGATTSTINNLLPGEYTVTVSAGGTCTDSQTWTIEDESELPNLFTEVTPTVCGLAVGLIDLSIEGGIPPYTIKWSNNKITEDIGNLPAGDYTVTVTTSVGCTATTTVNVPDNELPITLFPVLDDNHSCLSPDGSIYLDIFPPGYNYKYKWSNNSTQPNLVFIGGGTYTVTVTVGTCTVIESYTIQNIANPPNLAASATPANCSLPTGSAVANASGGLNPYKYKWTNGATTATINNLAPGTYTVTVTGLNGCSTTASVVVGNNNLALNITGTPTVNTSCVAGNGAIDVGVAPVGNYTYAWSNSATTEDISSLVAGTYVVTVTAGPTCTATSSFVVDNNTVNPTLLPAVTADICSQSIGAVNMNATGAGGGYTYAWSNSATTQNLTNIPSGTYSVTVTAANGCASDTTLTVANNSSSFSLSAAAAPLTNCAAANGQVNLTITPAGAYGIVWSTGATSEDISGLTSGTYTVTVTQAGSCVASASYVVDNLLAYPASNQSATPEICGLLNGALQVETSGGTGPYTYLWSNNATTEDLANIAGGTYTLTITDANNCTVTASANVPANGIPFSLNGTTAENTSCGINNGAVDLVVSPPGTYTYSWSNTATTEDIMAIPGGNYAVTVSAGGNCVNVANFIVADNTLAPIVSQAVTAALCAKSNGGINLTVSGSTTPYTFKWTGGATTEDLANIPAGTYAVTVTGANQCVTVDNFTVPDNAFTPSISAAPTANTSCTTPNGSAFATVTPTDIYTYIWSNGKNTPQISGLTAGMYTVTVSAGGACTASSTVIVDNDTQSATLDESISPAVCNQPVGSVNLTVNGGVPPYTYKWSNGAVTKDIGALLPGTYTVTVTSANNCTTEKTYTVNNVSNNFSVAESIQANTSCKTPNGAINLTLFPTGAYTFKWSNGQTSEDLNGLAPGAYNVTVTDNAACSAFYTYTLSEAIVPVEITGSVVDILCFGASTGTVQMDITSGTAPYTLTWSPAQPGNPQVLNNVPAGNYTVSVTDAMGCTETRTFAVTQPPSAVQIQCAQTSVVSQPGAVDGAGAVTISGGTAPYSVAWSPGGTQQNLPAGAFPISPLAEGSYAVTVIDANGCPINCGFNIGLVNCVTAVGAMSNSLLSRCGTGCITALYNAAGQNLEPEDGLQFILHTGSSNMIVGEIARNNQPVFCFDDVKMDYGVTYYISAVAGDKDASGNVDLTDYCTVVSFGTPIRFNEKPEATVAPPPVISCALKTVPLTAVSTISASAFQWSTAGTGVIVGNTGSSNVQASAAGIYTVVVTANGCADTVKVQVQDITNKPSALISANPSDVLDCKISEIVLSGDVNGTSNGNSVWMFGGNMIGTGSSVPIDAPGEYEFVVIDTITWCTDTALIHIGQNLVYPPLTLNPAGLLTCKVTSVTLSGASPFPGINYKWATINNGDTTVIALGQNVAVTAPGTYYLIGIDPANDCKNAESVTVNADVAAPQADAGDPFSIDCFGENADLDGTGSSGPFNLTYLWTTSDGKLTAGTTTPTPTINIPGTYTLLVTNPENGCTDTDVVVISPKAPIPTLEVKQPPCAGDKGSIRITEITGGAPPVKFSLNGGAFTTNTAFNALKGGNYTLLLIDAKGCSATTTATIIEPGPFKITVTPEAKIDFGETYQIVTKLSVPASDLAWVQWTPSTGLDCDTCLNTIARPSKSTRYEINVENKNGCKDRAFLLLRVDSELNIYVPNIFSPDGDNENDAFTIFAQDRQINKIQKMQIFSRWGEMVFEKYNFQPNDPSVGWDGLHKGAELNPGVFVWYAEIELFDGSVVLYKGDVTLLR